MRSSLSGMARALGFAGVLLSGALAAAPLAAAAALQTHESATPVGQARILMGPMPAVGEAAVVRLTALEPGMILQAPLLPAQERTRPWKSDAAVGIFWFLVLVTAVAASAARLEMRSRRRRQFRAARLGDRPA